MPSAFDKIEGLCKLLIPSRGKDLDDLQLEAEKRNVENLFINGTVLSTAALARNLSICETLGFCAESNGSYSLTDKGKTFKDASDKSGPFV